MINKKVAELAESTLIKIFIFFSAFTVSFITSGLTSTIVKPSNPESIENIYLAEGFSPEQNYLKVIWIITFSIVLYKLFLQLSIKRNRLFRILIVAIACFAVLSTHLLPYANSLHKNIDTFHHGEQLSPANAYNKGEGLFTDMYVLHGAGEDVLLPALSLRISNDESGIGMYYFVNMSLQLLSALIFLLLLAYIFKNTLLFLLTSTWFTFGAYSSFYYVRDIPIWIMLAAVLYLLTANSKRLTYPLIVLMGALSSSTLFFALDRGVIATFISVLFVLFLTIRSEKNKKIFVKVPKEIKDFKPLFFYGLGFTLIQAISLLILGWERYGNFVRTYFYEIPSYQGLLFNYPIYDISPPNFKIWLPLIIAALAIIMLIPTVIYEYRKRNFSTTTIFSVIILLGGIFFLRAGYGRSDWGHIAYSTPLLFIASFYIAYQYIKSANVKIKDEVWPIILMIVILFIPSSTFNFERYTNFLNVGPRESIQNFTSIKNQPDENWIPEKVKRINDYIKNNSDEDSSIFIFTQQPIYYYLSDRDNPSRFYIPWFADPYTLESELLESLKQDQPEIILYRNGDSWDEIDGVSMQKRAPRVDEWIKDNYEEGTKIDGAILLKYKHN